MNETIRSKRYFVVFPISDISFPFFTVNFFIAFLSAGSVSRPCFQQTDPPKPAYTKTRAQDPGLLFVASVIIASSSINLKLISCDFFGQISGCLPTQISDVSLRLPRSIPVAGSRLAVNSIITAAGLFRSST